MKRPGWVCLQSGLSGCWQHVSGWQVQRAPHPTALWPWFGVPPGGGRMLLAPSGRAFRLLVDCMAAVEAQVAAAGK